MRLVGTQEIRTMFGGISRQRVYELTSREDFPSPLAVLGMGKVWKYDDVAAWAQSRGRQVS